MAEGDNNVLRFSELSLYDEKIKEYIDSRPGGGGTITIDDTLSNSSTNPVQNKIINSALNTKFDINDNAENTIDNDDTVPFYDTSATEKKKISWTNLKTVLKSYFDNLYNNYTLPIASTSTPGGVIIDGTSIVIDNEGVISSSGSSNLSELNDVIISSPSNNDILKYNSTTEKWENGEGGSSTDVLNYEDTLEVLGLPPNPIYRFKIATPIMTSNTAPSGVASASGTSDATKYAAYKAFDGSTTTRWTGTQNVTNHWIQYKFDEAKIIYKIEIFAGAPDIQPSYRDMTVTVQGSNDGTTFIDLGSDQILVSDNLKYKTISYNNEIEYLYYRLQFTGYNVVFSGGNWTCIVEIKMYEKYLA